MKICTREISFFGLNRKNLYLRKNLDRRLFQEILICRVWFLYYLVKNAFNLQESFSLNLSYCFFSQFQQLLEGEERKLSSTIREN